MRVCLASPDILGPVRNGGVGTAFYGLGEALRDAGHEVTFFYTSRNYQYWSEDPDAWRAWFAEDGFGYLDLSNVASTEMSFINLGGAESNLRRAYETYKVLAASDFDLIHFPDYLGVGYYCLMAKKSGLAFSDTPLVVTAHGPSSWSREHGYTALQGNMPLLIAQMEQFVVEHADALISPSHYLLDWFGRRRWALPERAEHAFNRLPVRGYERLRALDRSAAIPRAGTRREIVFFGRIEQRKGIHLFIDAINWLLDYGDVNPRDLTVTLLGKFNDATFSRAILTRRLSSWPIAWRQIEWADADEALTYIARPGVIPVIPSLADNSPCTIQECLYHGIAFITTDVGGSAELIAERRNVVAPVASSLGQALAAALRDGLQPATPTVTNEAAGAALVRLHEDIAAAAAAIPARPFEEPMVSVCLLHRDRPELLAQAFMGFDRQTHRNFEVIVVDNGSRRPEADSFLRSLAHRAAGYPIEVIRCETNEFPGPARNIAVSRARGDILKFHDDDNISKDNELATFVTALRSGFDVVTAGFEYLDSYAMPDLDAPFTRGMLFMGDGGMLNGIVNLMGDCNFAIRKDRFLEMGGFDDLGFFYQAEDWVFLCKAKRAGLKIGTVPAPLFWYRLQPTRHSTNWRKLDTKGARFLASRALAGDDDLDALLVQLVLAGNIPGGIGRARGEDHASLLLDQAWVALSQIEQAIRQRDVMTLMRLVRAVRSGQANGSRTETMIEAVAKVAKKYRQTAEIAVDFDEAAYLDLNPDVKQAIERGEAKGAYAHYLTFGAREGRKRPLLKG